jgi:hypothetical protein
MSLNNHVGLAVSKMAQERALTAAQLSLLWIKDQPGVTALVIMDKGLNEADRPLFDEFVYPGTAAADFHNSNDWMKARFLV